MRSRSSPRIFLLGVVILAALLSAAAGPLLSDCGPFTDVSAFCGPILELYYLNVANGNSATTFAPDQTATRGEVSAFVARSFNQSMKRASRRAALGQWWLSSGVDSIELLSSGSSAGVAAACDGSNVFVAVGGATGGVSRIQASDGRQIGTWTGAVAAESVLVAMGQVFIATEGVGTSGGQLFRIDPREDSGTATLVASGVGGNPTAMTFDGTRIWVSSPEKLFERGSISIVTPGPSLPWSVTKITDGLVDSNGVVFDGSNIWTPDVVGFLRKLDSSGSVLLSVPIDPGAQSATFDGANIWIPTYTDPTVSTITVVRSSSGIVVAKFSGLYAGFFATFDGERMLVGSRSSDTVDVYRAGDLTLLGGFKVPGNPLGGCSDGINFWLPTANGLIRY